jgi:hypothetical protein
MDSLIYLRRDETGGTDEGIRLFEIDLTVARPELILNQASEHQQGSKDSNSM